MNPIISPTNTYFRIEILLYYKVYILTAFISYNVPDYIVNRCIQTIDWQELECIQ